MSISETPTPPIPRDRQALLTAMLARVVCAVRDRHTFFTEGIGDSVKTFDEQRDSLFDLWQLLTGEQLPDATLGVIVEYPIPNLQRGEPCSE